MVWLLTVEFGFLHSRQCEDSGEDLRKYPYRLSSIQVSELENDRPMIHESHHVTTKFFERRGGNDAHLVLRFLIMKSSKRFLLLQILRIVSHSGECPLSYIWFSKPRYVTV